MTLRECIRQISLNYLTKYPQSNDLYHQVIKSVRIGVLEATLDNFRLKGTSNHSEAAKIMGVARGTLYKWTTDYKLEITDEN